MNSRQRLLLALDHQEPDRIPLDLGSTQVTGIHVQAYEKLREALGMPPTSVNLCDAIQQLALPEADTITRLGVDVRGLYPLNSHNMVRMEQDSGDYWVYDDEWGITHQRSKPDGLYYSLVHAPLDRPGLTSEQLSSYSWPEMGDPTRIAGLRELAEHYRNEGYTVVLKDPFAGIFEMAQRLVGFERLLVMMVDEKRLAEALFDKLCALKLAFWEMALPRLGEVVDVVSQTDDYGSQSAMLISPAMYRLQIKPLWKAVFARIKGLAPHVRIFFHSCGSIRPLLPDFIETGVEILNPVHIRAAGMEPAALKRDFGAALTFWGGGVDTQGVLPYGSPKDVRDDVRRNIDALAPGGGFVFNQVHNIQADVPVENLLAMWEALGEYGIYG